MLDINTKRVTLAATRQRASWGYGTAVVALPETQSVVLSLPSAGPRSPWCAVDLLFGRVTTGTSMPGPFRAMTLPRPGDEDQRPWVLGLYGLGRLELNGERATVGDVIRKGIGTYPSTLVDYDLDVLAVGHRHRDSVVLVSAHDGARIKRLRAAGSVAYRLPDGLLRMVSFHHGEACDIDTKQHRVVNRHALPYGTGARLLDQGLVALLGERSTLRVSTTQGTEEVNFPGGWSVAGDELAVFDPLTLQETHVAAAPAGAVEVLGEDAAGRIVVARHRGLSVLALPTFAEIGVLDTDRDILGAGMIPGANLAAVIPHDREAAALLALRW